MLNPVALAIIANTFTELAERARAIGVFGSVSGLALALGPILGGALVDGLGWRFIFSVNVPIVAAAIVGTMLFVPESRAARARRFDPVGQALMILVLSSVVFAIIESSRFGWTSPVILGLFAGAALGVAGIALYEPRRADPLLELRLFRSVPFSAAIVEALFALCAFGAFLFVTTEMVDLQHKFGVLRRHCEDAGRDYDEIVKTTTGRLGDDRDLGRVTARFSALADLGVDLAIVDLPDAQDAGVFDFLGKLAGELEPLGRPVPPGLA